MNDFVIEKVSSREKYEGLRDLWVRIFGDEPGFVDAFYETFGADLSFESGSDEISGFVICNDDGQVVSALTLYRCGSMYVPKEYGLDPDSDEEDEEYAEYIAALLDLDGLPVYVSYAICTDPEYRGQGLAAALTEYVRKLVTSDTGLRGISLVSPAEASLIGFYSELGYREGFYASEGIGFPEMLEFSEGFDEDYDDLYDDPEAESMMWGLGPDGMPGLIEDEDGFDTFEPEMSVTRADTTIYDRYREAFLSDTVHVSLSSNMLALIRMCSLEGDGLLIINGGDAVAVMGETGRIADELLVSPMLMEISSEIEAEIAARLAKSFGLERLTYRTPGYGISQSMYAASADHEITGYFGFPIE